MEKNIDVFFIIDNSHSTRHYIRSLNGLIRRFIVRIRHDHNLRGYKVHINILTFNTMFNYKQDYLLNHKNLRDVTATRIKIKHTNGATDPEVAIKTALSKGLLQYFEWKAQGKSPVKPFYFLFTDGCFDYGSVDGEARDEEKQKNLIERYKAVAEEIRLYEKNQCLSFFVCAFDMMDKPANTDLLKLLSESDEHIVLMKPSSAVNEISKLTAVFSEIKIID